MSLHVYGIRHHGPGSARSLLRALEELAPDLLLIEGPPDAEAILPLAAHEAMRPPLALLVYDPEAPRRCVFFPFAEFSPEWQAIRFALRRGVPVRFMDLPQSHELALQRKAEEEFKKHLEAGDSAAEAESSQAEQEQAASAPNTEQAPDGREESCEGVDDEPQLAARRDPLSLLARAAGYDDSERWWERLVEARQDSVGLFAAILEAMDALRAELNGGAAACDGEREARREAWMRQTIRAAEKEGFERIAIICGAWHAPALAALPPARADAALLKGLPKLKVQSTWIPWTYGRLARESGYGAGVLSPGWYDFLWRHASTHPAPANDAISPVNPQSNIPHLVNPQSAIRNPQSSSLAAGWLSRVAALLREKGFDISTAHVIEAVRLAEALSAMRGHPAPGLPELGDATLSVILNGEAAPLQLIHKELIVGERLGEVPADVPQIPLQQDLQRQQKSLRLPPTADSKDYDFDLRKPGDLARSQLLHRLRLLGIPWGELITASVRSQGTFREAWRLQWQPEFAVALIEASAWGNTVESAAAARAMHRAGEARQLADLTNLIDAVLLADLPEAVAHVMARLEAEAAVAADVAQMMEAIPPLAQAARYGTVRRADAALLGRVLDGLVARVCIGLDSACASLDDEAAESMLRRLLAVDGALHTLENSGHLAQWRGALGRLADRDGLHGLVAGRACRILLESGDMNPPEAGRRMGLALSRGADPIQGAAWLEGFLRGSGMLLLHTEALWAILDGWICTLNEEAFTELLPILRRTFASFPAPERRMMGERVKRDRGPAQARPVNLEEDDALVHERAAKVLPILEQLLGACAPQKG